MFNTITFNHYIMDLWKVAIQVRSALIAAIFRKSVNLSNSARKKFTSGEITNLISVDCQRVLDGMPYLVLLWGSPLKVILSLVLVYVELGLAAVIGSIGLALLIPPNIIGGKVINDLQTKQLAAKDSRIKVCMQTSLYRAQWCFTDIVFS